MTDLSTRPHTATYRGHTITVRRERCLGGWDMLYTTIIRDRDGFFCTELAEDSAETISDQLRYMKRRIDAELAEPDPWGENGDEDGDA